MTCQTCKHWEENQPQSEEDREVGAGVHELDTPGWGQCVLTETHNGNFTQSLAVAMDAEAYHAVLLTRPAFSCNQHEAKE